MENTKDINNIENTKDINNIENTENKWIDIPHKKNNIQRIIFKDYGTINQKKLLCKNIINQKICSYGNKCHFAHNLEEQNVNSKRKYAYSILTLNDLSHISLDENFTLYKSLLELTFICKDCITNKCSGGYNCKFGTCLSKYHVCNNDLIDGNCTNANCTKIHLTKKGLIPYNKKIIKQTKTFKLNYLENNINNNNNNNNINNINNINIIKNNIIENIVDNNKYDDDDENISICTVTDNDNDTDECNTSIFG
jgi:hypothetical protein